MLMSLLGSSTFVKNRDLSNKFQISYSAGADMLMYFCFRKIFDYR